MKVVTKGVGGLILMVVGAIGLVVVFIAHMSDASDAGLYAENTVNVAGYVSMGGLIVSGYVVHVLEGILYQLKVSSGTHEVQR